MVMHTYNLIKSFSEFVLNETLQTHDIDVTIKNVIHELSLHNINIHIVKSNNNTFNLYIKNVNKINDIKLHLDYISSLITNRHGWFPSKMELTNLNNLENLLIYDEDIIIDKYKFLKRVVITYESKYDIEVNVPDKLYHLSIVQFETSVIKNGLIPKSKSKLSKHMDRIYVCDNIDYCYNLIKDMKLNYSSIKFKNNSNVIDDNWIIYEIDTHNLNIKLYSDPNYTHGFYIIDNIPSDNIKIIDKE